MSDVTPFSYIDDGVSFAHRLPPSTSFINISQWLNSTASDATSTYTGSYIDDGADLLLPTGPGFGKIDPRFYKHKKRRGIEDAGLWNDSIARAISGDVQRSVAKMQGIADLEVKRPEKNKEEDRKRRQRRETVRVPAPIKWGTFIIKGDDGRIIVIDEKGEFDSGPVKKADINNGVANGEKRWVKAASSVGVPSSTHQSVLPDDSTTTSTKDNESDSKPRLRGKSKPRASRLCDLALKTKSLSTIPESSYETDSYVKISPLASPTNFFMTGGLSGWPSRAPTPDPPSPIVPHSITWDTTSPLRGTQADVKSNLLSPVHSPLGRWPSPPSSPVKSNSSFSDLKHHEVWDKGSSRSSKGGKTKSRSSSSEKKTKKVDDMSTKTYSTYRPPTIVEVIYDETPPGEVSHSQVGWGGGQAVSAHGWGGSKASDSVKSMHTRSSVYDRGWGGSASAFKWDERKPGSKTDVNDYWTDNDNDNDNDRNRYDNWDGFERRKTTSEISVAGSESERSWPKSQRSQRTQHGHPAYRSHRSHESSRYDQTDWSDSQMSRKSNSNMQWDGSKAQWGGSNAQSVNSSLKSKQGSESSWYESNPARPAGRIISTAKHHDGYDDFDQSNETHQKRTWGRVPVRMASRRTSVAGWD